MFIFILYPFLFVGMWCAVSLALAALGGWRRLAVSFPARTQPTGRCFYMQGGKVGQVSYGGCLAICSSPQGVCLSVLLPFRLGHPPLFIRWNAVRNATTRRFLWTEYIAFDVGSPSIATMRLPKKVLEGHHVAG